MTLDEKIQQAANKFSNTLKQSNYAAEVYHPGSYYAGVDNGFYAGAKFTKSELMTLLEKALDALDWYAIHDQKMESDYARSRIWLRAKATAQEIRERLK